VRRGVRREGDWVWGERGASGLGTLPPAWVGRAAGAALRRPALAPSALLPAGAPVLAARFGGGWKPARPSPRISSSLPAPCPDSGEHKGTGHKKNDGLYSNKMRGCARTGTGHSYAGGHLKSQITDLKSLPPGSPPPPRKLPIVSIFVTLSRAVDFRVDPDDRDTMPPPPARHSLKGRDCRSFAALAVSNRENSCSTEHL